MSDKDVVVIHSGGLDSTVLLYELRSKGFIVGALSINYGQRHLKELVASELICKKLGIPRFEAYISKELFQGSTLTNGGPVPEGHYAAESMKQIIVPNRNMVFLSLAAAYAMSLGYLGIAYAAHVGNHVIYPDCRPQFTNMMKSLLWNTNKISLMTPFINFRKEYIVKRGFELGVPFELTWSCYNGMRHHCGVCGACVERREAFQLGGVHDPIKYEEIQNELDGTGTSASRS